MNRLHIDIETYSPEPIADSGLYRYAMHPDFEILLVAYAIDEEPVQIIDLATGSKLPDWFVEALLSPQVRKVAHNAAFERVCLTMYLRRLGVLYKDEWLLPEQWHCTMVQASRCGLPMSLAGAGEALGLERQKMTEGKTLIKVFCTPHKAKSGLFGETERVLPSERPEDWQTFKDYCVRDVDVERQIDDATVWLLSPDWELELYAADQRINDRGVLVDTDLAREAVKVGAVITARLNEEAMKLTGLSNPNSVSQLKAWLSEATGVSLESLSKKDLPDIRKATNDPRVHRVLDIRAQLGKSSNAKYEAMLACVGADDRVRGLLQFYGARTGRWAGRLVQLQNLPQNHIPDLDFARQALKDGDIEMLELGYGNVPDTLSQLIRTAFVAPEGKTLAVCDFSAIEARTLAWLAGEEWVLDTFRSGGDIYCATASQMFHVPVEKHGRNAELRQKGKIAVLALGYGGGVGALDAMGGQRLGMTEQEEQDTVSKWRMANPSIVAYWRNVEDAALTIIRGYAQTVEVGRILFTKYDHWLLCQLPSGRMIAWPHAEETVNRFGSPSIRYKGINQTTNKWCWLETFGGKLTENITQAVARDCLADVILRVETGCKNIGIVFHVHDEIVAEVSADHAARALEIIQEAFAKVPAWATGLPLRGAGYVTPYYLKD